jgi:hypothetical protein
MKTAPAVWAASFAGIVVIGFAAGWLIRGSGAAGFAFDTSAQAYEAADLPGGHSKAGFTGFDDVGGLAGATIISGRVTAVDANSITVATATGQSTIRLTGQDRLRLLQPLSGAIAPGTTVVATRKPGSDDIAAVLAIVDP